MISVGWFVVSSCWPAMFVSSSRVWLSWMLASMMFWIERVNDFDTSLRKATWASRCERTAGVTDWENRNMDSLSKV